MPAIQRRGALAPPIDPQILPLPPVDSAAPLWQISPPLRICKSFLAWIPSPPSSHRRPLAVCSLLQCRETSLSSLSYTLHNSFDPPLPLLPQAFVALTRPRGLIKSAPSMAFSTSPRALLASSPLPLLAPRAIPSRRLVNPPLPLVPPDPLVLRPPPPPSSAKNAQQHNTP